MDKFEVLKVLGKGSFGRALLCRDFESKEHVVVKEIQVADKAAVDEAQKEAILLQQHSHTNIVRYIASFGDTRSHVFYLVMEYADGGDLSAAISRRRSKSQPWPEQDAMFIFVQCLLALRHVHARRIVHRDLKAQNVFLTRLGVVKLGDFGVSKALQKQDGGATELARTQVGTPYYLSPEIFEGRKYGRKSDMWSLGVLLYEVLALRMPFEAPSLAALCRRVTSGAAPSYAPLCRYTADAKALVASLLTMSPAQRPTADQLLRQRYVRSHIQRSLSQTMDGGAALALSADAQGLDLAEAPARNGARQQQVQKVQQVHQQRAARDRGERDAAAAGRNTAAQGAAGRAAQQQQQQQQLAAAQERQQERQQQEKAQAERRIRRAAAFEEEKKQRLAHAERLRAERKRRDEADRQAKDRMQKRPGWNSGADSDEADAKDQNDDDDDDYADTVYHEAKQTELDLAEIEDFANFERDATQPMDDDDATLGYDEEEVEEWRPPAAIGAGVNDLFPQALVDEYARRKDEARRNREKVCGAPPSAADARPPDSVFLDRAPDSAQRPASEGSMRLSSEARELRGVAQRVEPAPPRRQWQQPSAQEQFWQNREIMERGRARGRDEHQAPVPRQDRAPDSSRLEVQRRPDVEERRRVHAEAARLQFHENRDVASAMARRFKEEQGLAPSPLRAYDPERVARVRDGARGDREDVRLEHEAALQQERDRMAAMRKDILRRRESDGEAAGEDKASDMLLEFDMRSNPATAARKPVMGLRPPRRTRSDDKSISQADDDASQATQVMMFSQASQAPRPALERRRGNGPRTVVVPSMVENARPPATDFVDLASAYDQPADAKPRGPRRRRWGDDGGEAKGDDDNGPDAAPRPVAESAARQPRRAASDPRPTEARSVGGMVAALDGMTAASGMMVGNPCCNDDRVSRASWRTARARRRSLLPHAT
mmetsp:Transcript_8791/g.30255  ORF Transcript_8791/g.30255 Transcript_8791/m.30255 type:complete len:946 (+) Transcript_8791:122-2959(+)